MTSVQYCIETSSQEAFHLLYIDGVQDEGVVEGVRAVNTVLLLLNACCLEDRGLSAAVWVGPNLAMAWSMTRADVAGSTGSWPDHSELWNPKFVHWRNRLWH